jgi:hypothetical protein
LDPLLSSALVRAVPAIPELTLRHLLRTHSEAFQWDSAFVSSRLQHLQTLIDRLLPAHLPATVGAAGAKLTAAHLVSRCPSLLIYRHLKRVPSAMETVGRLFRGADVRELVYRWPAVLTLDLKREVPKKLRMLKALLESGWTDVATYKPIALERAMGKGLARRADLVMARLNFDQNTTIQVSDWTLTSACVVFGGAEHVVWCGVSLHSFCVHFLNC